VLQAQIAALRRITGKTRMRLSSVMQAFNYGGAPLLPTNWIAVYQAAESEGDVKTVEVDNNYRWAYCPLMGCKDQVFGTDYVFDIENLQSPSP